MFLLKARSYLSEQQREELVRLFEQGFGSQAAATYLGVPRYPVRKLARRWKLHGRLCLVEKPTKKQYSFEIKKQVVTRFLDGETRMELAAEFGLSSEQLVHAWVRAWRDGGGRALMPKPKGRPKGSARPKPLAEK